ncbi:MAG: glutaminase [Gammaproteobacteria bacterium]|jgi:glutaminase
MKQGLWLVVTAALAVGALISVVDLEARQTVSPQVHEGDSALMAADMKRLQRDAREVAATLAGNKEGNVYSAAVPGTDPGHLALAVALVDGRIFSVGEADVRFPLMSISKPFTYALALEQHGVDFMIDHIGVSATGFSYNAVAAGAVRRTSEQNPLVNAGAIATHGYIEGATPADKISAVIALYSRMANRTLSIEETWHVTPRALTYTLAYQMKASGRLEGDVEDIIERYLESNIVAVTVEDLARMGATLAAGGIQPQTGERILKSGTVRTVLSVMVIAGMYEGSGLWWTRVGLPAKSGVSGAILAVVPGWGAIAAYSPRLDEAGNSVRGALAIRELADRWNLHSIDRLMKPEPQE